VYDKDPAKFKDAAMLTRMSFHDAVSNQAVAVMDKAALGLALEQKKPLLVFNPMTPGNIALAVSGKPLGTKID
jgi:uridylate kinase